MKLVIQIFVLNLLLHFCNCKAVIIPNIIDFSNEMDNSKDIDDPDARNPFGLFEIPKNFSIFPPQISFPDIFNNSGLPNIVNISVLPDIFNNSIINIPNLVDITKIFDIPGIKNLPNVLGRPLLTPRDCIINLFKQTVFGGPFLIGATLISAACQLLLHSGILEARILPDIKNINFQFRDSNCIKVTVPILQAEKLLNEPLFDRNRDTVLLISGWLSGMNDAVDILSKAYRCRRDTNILVLDAAHFLDTFYTWSSLNTEKIGEYAAIGLQRLSIGYNIDKIHVIGHSLGAHIASSIGRSYERLTGRKLQRITGLEPANPCFYDGQKLPGLQRNDAVFVDVIHTNPGVLGTAATVGNVDIFVGKRSDTLQNGCIDIVCSHERSVAFYAESVYEINRYNFPLEKCESNGNADYLGYILNTRYGQTYGICTLHVNGEQPYGKNGTCKFISAVRECGKC